MKMIFLCRQCAERLNVDHSQIGTNVRCSNCDAVQPVPAPLAKRYRVLALAVPMIQAIAVLVTLALITTILVVISRYYQWSDAPALVLLLVGIPASLVSGVLIFAVAESIRLCIDLEENTRATRLLLEMMRTERRPAPVETPQ